MAEDMFPKPSVGQIVHYSNGGECTAAVITNVWSEGTVDLTIFPAGINPVFASEIKQGTRHNQWHWPERV